MRRLPTMILGAIALSGASYAFAAPAWLNRAIVPVKYVQIADDIYATASLSDADRRRALADVQAARLRITGMFGAPRARPVTIIAATDAEAAGLGLLEGVPGSAFITPFGTQVVLSMPNFSVDVTAHELMHAEVADRLGFWAWAVRLPVWFDEGLALQLDWRRGYMIDCASLGARRILEVQTLMRPWQFWDGGRDQVIANYRAAKCAAAQVLERQPPRLLYASMARLRGGENFAKVFATTGDEGPGGQVLH